ncbi:hypothetical protein BOTBODRAFT_36886 [Botryobasidium botryosum FD-172 SS1]|uniref:Uncharacterized protein n=1 Tax=Botryobasidium botryosum (strain FD-172 SS1) TaxID=930990 RepID=A0A067M253_BOTB1|nr:hypothetical protein BOTBODRAFT_36886 [Botryobasidium botryosum FD-172 SS1]
MPVNKGDILLVPSAVSDENRIHVQWQQSLQNKEADYISVITRNKSQGEESVILFVQADWFNDQHLGAKGEHDYYEVKIDEKFQYGQKNSKGDNRWVVLHDHSRKPYQHRFVESLFSKAGTFAGKVAALAGFPIVDKVIPSLKGFLGDYLHNF